MLRGEEEEIVKERERERGKRKAAFPNEVSVVY